MHSLNVNNSMLV